MSDHDIAAELRRRADRLARLAASIESTPALELDRLAGPTTWTGRRAHRLVDELRRHQSRLHTAADDLGERAWWLQRRADVADAAGAAGPVGTVR